MKRPLTPEELAEARELHDLRAAHDAAGRALAAREANLAYRLYPAMTGLTPGEKYATRRIVRSYTKPDKKVLFHFMPVSPHLAFDRTGTLQAHATIRQLNSLGEYNGRTSLLSEDELDAATPMEVKS